MLRYIKESSAEVLKDFECGVQVMDDFIHHDLDSFLKNDPRYNFYVAVDDENGIVAMYVTSAGIFVDHDGEFQDMPFGKPWGYLDEDFQIHSGTMYPTLEIDYLAIRKDLREKGYGTEVLSYLSNKASNNKCYFLTVDAYHDKEYSAIPFYEKRGFFALQEYSEDVDAFRMAKRV